LLLPLSQGAQWGWTSPLVLGLLGTAVILAVLWFGVELRSSNPMIDMKIMRLPAVWTTNLVALLLGGTMFAIFTFVPQLVQIPVSSGYGFGATVTQAGWLMLPMLVTMAITGMLSGAISPFFQFKAQLTWGSGIIALSCAAIAFFHSEIWQVVLASGAYGIGLGLAYATMTSLIVQNVPATQTGVATGMNANIRTIGGAIGTAAMSAIVTANRQDGGLPSEQGFTNGFALFAIVAALAFGVALLVPGGRKAATAAPQEAMPTTPITDLV
jgi:MFS family permease